MATKNPFNPFSAYANVEDTTPRDKQYFVHPGKCRVKVTRFAFTASEKDGSMWAVMETEVIDPGTTEHRVGDTPSWCKRHAQNKITASEIRACCAAVCGVSFEECTPDVMQGAFEEGEALVGTVLDVAIWEKVRESDGAKFHNTRFTHVAGPEAA